MLVTQLPSNSGWRLTTLENDDMVRTSVANLISLSEHQISIVIKELLLHLELLNRVSAKARDRNSIYC